MPGRGKGMYGGKYPLLTVPRQQQGVCRNRRKASGTTRRQHPRTRPAAIYPCPGGRHGRVGIYQPTPQPDLKYKLWRGNTPAGVSRVVYDNAYNNENCTIHKGISADAAKGARECGLVRDLTIDKLIRIGLLPYDFVDDDI
ncbi:hypothetical protein L207DRAFT_7036 [Hyaloscypha variabilis F]|uniref:Uncharacterized protein n=1 Tax=Hyaloscypha variabilis (strain UAMH 11265 / GT02V1 / F) TaxID=1149755 RepID=A0A2J6SCE2_HYAVF|nr:hypothetical protein L207DRAFT_7036 [Hyaloscypha variabilis F]